MFQTTRDKVKAFIVWLMMLNDTPHSIAMGVAVGFFVGVTPTMGVQMLIVALISMFVRLNRTAGCTLVWLTNPLTMLPVCFANYMVGTWLLRIQPRGRTFFVSEIQRAYAYEQWYERLWLMLKAFGRLSVDLAWPLWLGSVVVGIAGAVPLYFIVRKVVISYRRRHRRRLEAALAREAGSTTSESVEREPSDGKALQDR